MLDVTKSTKTPRSTTLLGSKDLGTNVFKTLMCIVSKP